MSNAFRQDLPVGAPQNIARFPAANQKSAIAGALFWFDSTLNDS